MLSFLNKLCTRIDCIACADIIRLSPLMSDEFRMRSRQRFDKLLPVELDASLTIEQKIPTVIASFEEGFADIVDSKVVNRKTLAQMINEARNDFQLRYEIFDRFGIFLTHTLT